MRAAKARFSYRLWCSSGHGHVGGLQEKPRVMASPGWFRWWKSPRRPSQILRLMIVAISHVNCASKQLHQTQVKYYCIWIRIWYDDILIYCLLTYMTLWNCNSCFCCMISLYRVRCRTEDTQQWMVASWFYMFFIKAGCHIPYFLRLWCCWCACQVRSVATRCFATLQAAEKAIENKAMLCRDL